MPCYFDREGRSIARERWETLVRDPGHNPVLMRQKGAGWQVEASWVGWCSLSESPPKPFLVTSAGLKVKTEDYPDAWFARPEQAREEAAARVLRLSRKGPFPVEAGNGEVV